MAEGHASSSRTNPSLSPRTSSHLTMFAPCALQVSKCVRHTNSTVGFVKVSVEFALKSRPNSPNSEAIVSCESIKGVYMLRGVAGCWTDLFRGNSTKTAEFAHSSRRVPPVLWAWITLITHVGKHCWEVGAACLPAPNVEKSSLRFDSSSLEYRKLRVWRFKLVVLASATIVPVGQVVQHTSRRLLMQRNLSLIEKNDLTTSVIGSTSWGFPVWPCLLCSERHLSLLFVYLLL